MFMKNKKINLTVRLKNPLFWVQVGGAMLVTALAYHSMQPQDLTTWYGLVDLGKGVLSNPYLIGLCLWNAWSSANDPTTWGIGDSKQALTYEKPKKDGGQE